MSSKHQSLSKRLGLFDVYVISTGAMFSSGFFLLPGIAASQTGPSVVLAYLVSGFLILPAMLSQAELAAAMPRAGGAYFFLDRTLGPLVGTLGGIGTWVALMLKSAFALIGMGAYVTIFLDVPIKPAAIVLTAVFAVLNVIGTKESSGVIRVLVAGVLGVLILFVTLGLAEVGSAGAFSSGTPFLTDGFDGFLGTVGLVFVSYVGLTKVASVAEEVRKPDRNIPLGMALSLGTVVTVYTLGVFVMVRVMGIDQLEASLTPVTDAAREISLVPGNIAVIVTVVAAIAAFSSMANAGILASSRYPLAMARDRLVPNVFAKLGGFNTPVLSILTTCGLIVLFLLVLNIAEVAKLASALQLVIFGLVNVAVIVMRESLIESYDPGFRSPLYPWMQLTGIIIPFVLVAEMGWFAGLFTLGVCIIAFGWYRYYAQDRIARDGAIYHVFERLGRRRFAGLDRELRDIMKEKGVRAEDPFDEAVARAFVMDGRDPAPLNDIIDRAAEALARRIEVDADELANRFLEGRGLGMPVSHGAAIFHTRIAGVDPAQMALVRCQRGIDPEDTTSLGSDLPIQAMFFLVSDDTDAGRHLRLLAQLAGKVEEDGFMSSWLAADDEQDLKEILLRDDRFLTLVLQSGDKSESLIGKALKELRMPEGSLVALIRRYGVTLVPRGGTILRQGDRLTIIGEPQGLSKLREEWGGE
ncbi:MAG: amino acid permease [Gemmatimonadales bacterium]